MLAFDTVALEADAANKDFADHLAHLLVHGLLHLLGFDHKSEADAAQMETREIFLLAGIGVDDPYNAGDASTEEGGTGKGSSGGDRMSDLTHGNSEETFLSRLWRRVRVFRAKFTRKY